MTQHQLDHAIARSTGEALRTIRHLGFAAENPSISEPSPEDLALVLDCPFCRRRVVLVTPGSTNRELPVVAECDPCDVYFDYRLDEIYVSTPEPVHSIAATA